MSSFEYVKLTDICTPKQWKTVSLSELSNEGYLCYGANGVIGRYKDYNHQDETIIIGCRGSCGNISISKPYSYISGNAMCLENIDNRINKKYLYYALKMVDFSKIITGSSQPQITRYGLSKVSVKIWDDAMQCSIVKTLDICEKIISTIAELNDKYDLLIKSQFVEMFGDLKTNDKHWQTVSLSTISKYYNGLTYSPDTISENGIIVLRSSNIQNGNLDLNDIVRVDCKISEKYFVKDGDIIMCARNGSAKLVGKVALIDNIEEPMCFGAFMMIVRSEHPNYLKVVFESDFFRTQISSGISTTTINQITNGMLDKVCLPLPSDALLKKFDCFMDQIDKSKLINVF